MTTTPDQHQTAPPETTSRTASGYGLATTAANGSVLDVWFPAPALGELSAQDASVKEQLAAAAQDDAERGTTQSVVAAQIDLDAAPADTADAWLRLHLLSHRLAAPNTLNLDGVFGLLTNVVWTNYGPCAVQDFELTRLKLRSRGPVAVYGVDKFPRMTDYVVPTGVRIGDADRVRLGAHLAEGTTVMHEGFVNFNAGTRVAVRQGSGTEAEETTVKAVELSGVSNLLFRRDSATGQVQALPRAGQTVELNSALHAN